jgi:hypothetical protein
MAPGGQRRAPSTGHLLPISVVSHSNQEIGYRDWGFSWSSSVPTRTLPSTSFPINYALIILLFDATEKSLNKPQINTNDRHWSTHIGVPTLEYPMDGRLHGSQSLCMRWRKWSYLFSGIEPQSSSYYIVTKPTELPWPRRHYKRTYTT